jgi:hypothetical protein
MKVADCTRNFTVKKKTVAIGVFSTLTHDKRGFTAQVKRAETSERLAAEATPFPSPTTNPLSNRQWS